MIYKRLLFAAILAATASGCAVYVRSNSSCYNEYVNDPYGGYYQRYCYNTGYGGYVPAVNRGHYVVYYPNHYRGPRTVVAHHPGTAPRVIVNPNPRYHTPYRSPSRPVVTPPPSRRPTVSPSRDGGRGRSAPPTRSRPPVHPRVSTIEVPASQIRVANLMGENFRYTQVSHVIDPTLEAGKVRIETTVLAESDAQAEDFMQSLEHMDSNIVNVNRRSISINPRENCALDDSDDQVSVEGVCIGQIQVITSEGANPLQVEITAGAE